MSTSFLGPDVDHLSCEIEWIRETSGSCKGDSEHAGLDVVVREVLIQPQEEEFILAESVQGAESCPEKELTGI